MSTTYWYVEPGDAHTNKVIAESLLTTSQLNENVALADNNGDEHSVFQVENYSFVTRLFKDRAKLTLSFKVFSRAGMNAPLKLWELGEKKKKTVVKKTPKKAQTVRKK